MEQLNEVKAIWQAELQRTLRSGRVLVLLGLYGVFSLLVLLVVGTLSRALSQKLIEAGGDPRAAEAAFSQGRSAILAVLFSTGDPAMLEALKQVPLVVLIVFKVTSFFLPAYVALMGFDQLSGDVANRSIRYLVVRARRSSALLGKLLTQATLLLALVIAVDLGIFLYAKITTPTFTVPDAAIYLLKFWLAAIVFSSAYIALTSLCSALVRTPAMSLVLNLLALFGFWLLDVIGASDPSRDFLRYLSPSHYPNGLLNPGLVPFATSVVAYLVFAIVFVGAAYLILRVRDL